jgi:hypothetical protein
MLAEAQAQKGHLSKEKLYRSLVHREKQRRMARCIQFLRGKVLAGSTSMIQVRNEDGSWKDVYDKNEIEQAIMASTQKKFKTSFNTPFMQPPLVGHFGYMGTGRAVDAVLDGEFTTPTEVDEFTA